MKLVLKTLFIAFAFLNISISTATAQLGNDHVKWNTKIEYSKDFATVIFEATIEPNWEIAPVYRPENCTANPTVIKLTKSGDYELIGKITEPKFHSEYDDVIDEVVAYHVGKPVFKQKIKIISKKDFVLKYSYEFTTCQINANCLPPYSATGSIKVKGNPDAESTVATSETDTTNVAVTDNKTPVNTDDKTTNSKGNKVDKKDSKKESRTPWGIFIGAFFAGFLALIMPCVFPMIPMTVSFFTKRSKTRSLGIRNAFLYGSSIILIHVLLGAIVVVTKTQDLLNKWSTDPIFNIFFFLMLFIFGLSFLGGFEIQLPAKWVNKADEKADKGGVVGIFFMALVLSLASFSCTGPLLGTLLGELARVGGGSNLMIGMFAFGLALAIPFMLFALFPSWLNSMPSSGGWLNVVKVFLGFIEIAFAFKFLSSADTTMQWHLLEREVFIAIWIALFGTLAMYLLGKIRLPHDSPVEKLSVGRTMMATMTLAFTIYLIPGLWGAPLNLVNAYLPPSFYAESPQGIGGGGTAKADGDHVDGMHEGPQGIPAFHDYDKALAYAKKVNKPLFVDYTGWGCTNCRKMEATVWGQPGVIEHLKNDVVIVSLYVDERTELPKSEQKTIKLNGNDFPIVTIGNKWTAKQIQEYETASQPYYVLQTPEGKDIPVGSADYQNHSNPKVFQAWLEKGLKQSK